MMRLVVDASVIVKLFSPQAERHIEQAAALLTLWEQGDVALIAPELMLLEVLNVAARKWLLEEPALHMLAQALADLQVDIRPAEMERVAAWSRAGLTAYDAAYVAVAEVERVPLLTDDDDLVRLAPAVSVSLATYSMTA